MEPPSPPPPEERIAPARPRRFSAFASGTLAAVVLVTGASIATASSQATDVLGGAAADYVPSDGHHEWLLDNFDAVRLSESARSIGFEDILKLPIDAGSAIINQLGDGAEVAQLWRESSLTVRGSELDEAGTQTVDLHQLSADGLVLLAGYGGNIGFAYSPPLLELPAAVAPGSTWSSAGDALPNGVMTYRSQFQASLPSNSELIAAAGLLGPELVECLQTDGTALYLDSAGETVLDIAESDLWCKGRGRVAIVATVNGTPIVQGPLSSAPAPTAATASTARFDWSNSRDWAANDVAPISVDNFFGEQQLSISLANPPRRTASGLIVAVNQFGDDVVALRLESGSLVQEWFAHPGGEVISLETAGDVTIVTTSLRQIVAYAESGQRLWGKSSAELVFATPTDAGDGTVIVVALDGAVSSFDRYTGDVVWESKLAADVRLPASVAGDSVVIIDRAGAMTAFDRATGETVWENDSHGVPTLAAAASGAIIVADEDGFLRAYDAANGARGWVLRYVGVLRSIVNLEGTAVVVTTEATTAIDVATGAIRWIRAGAQDAVTDGSHAVLFDEDSASLVDGAGSTLAQWRIPSLALSIYRYALAGEDGFWVLRSTQPAVKVGRP